MTLSSKKISIVLSLPQPGAISCASAATTAATSASATGDTGTATPATTATGSRDSCEWHEQYYVYVYAPTHFILKNETGLIRFQIQNVLAVYAS